MLTPRNEMFTKEHFAAAAKAHVEADLWKAYQAATAAEEAARRAYMAIEESAAPDHAALRIAQDALTDAVNAEDAARAAYEAALSE
jgi:hypothetical protein